MREQLYALISFGGLMGRMVFEEYRRDPEDNTGWFAIGHHAHKIFTNIDSAKNAAIQQVGWLKGFSVPTVSGGAF